MRKEVQKPLIFEGHGHRPLIEKGYGAEVNIMVFLTTVKLCSPGPSSVKTC